MKKTSIIVLTFLCLVSVGFGKPKKKVGVVKAHEEGKTSKQIVDSFSYAIGVLEWGNFVKNKVNVSVEGFVQAIMDVKDNKGQMDENVATEIVQKRFKQLMADNLGKEKQRSQVFLDNLKKNPKVKEIMAGLYYEVLSDSVGPKPNDSSKVKVHYIGTLIDGKEFDNSYKRGEPVVFPVNGVIKGWTEALKQMPVGSKWKVYIGSDLGYGDRGAGNGIIPPGATLVFEIHLIGIEK